ncbi:hypothetical protein [Methanocella conradii]|uniref:hypothetical protein n=1 Tax=Methanocella conradii TaxID=1175444 RepID=UPI00157C1ED6|nr:hypothetical protein [Methanocella conradii]
MVISTDEIVMKTLQNTYQLIKERSYNRDLLVLLLYLILTIVLTYPLILHMTESIFGTRGDSFQVLYILWYAKQALLNQNPNMTLDYTNYIFYPTGIYLSFLSSPFNQLISIPLQELFGLPATYNIIWLLSFVLGGFGTYLLVKYLTGNEIAAFFSGIVFAFAPYHFAHALGHMGATTIEWIPFCALYLIKMVREKGMKNYILAAVFFILVGASDLQYMIFTAIFAGLLLLFEIIEAIITSHGESRIDYAIKKIKEIIPGFIVFGVISLLIVVPLNYSMISIAISDNNYLKPEESESMRYSADLVGFFIPSALHPLFGGWLQANVYNKFVGNVVEYTTFIGYTVLLLALYAIITRRMEKYVIFWTISAISFFIFSLGPVLHLLGNTDFFGFTVTLPFALLKHIVPFLENTRTPGRFDVLVMLSFAVLSGYGLASLLSRARNNSRRYLFASVLVLLLLFEFWSTSMISAVKAPTFYEEIGKDTETYALLEIPASTNYSCGLYCEYYQTVGNKPMVGGQVARWPHDIRDFEINTPYIHQLTYLSNTSEDIFDQNITDIGSSILQYYNIRYVIVHRDYLSGPQLHAVTDYLNASPHMELVDYADDNITVYRVSNGSMKLFMIPGDGWWYVEQWGENFTRWMNDNATLFVYSPSPGDFNLSFASLGINNNTLQVFVNGKKVYEKQMNPSFTSVKVPIRLNEGDNIVWFKSTDGSIRPCDISELNSTDTRNISFAFQNVSIL